MKKHVLIGSVLLAAMSAFSQTNNRPRPTGLIDTKTLLQTKFGDSQVFPTAKESPVKPTAVTHGGKPASKTASSTWQSISSSMNIYGVIISYCKPLQWNDELDAVSFIHRKSPSYIVSPAPIPTAETGAIVAMVSTDCGTSWDSTAIYSNDNFWGRYPGGAIYNPPANTNIDNAYIVGAGPATGPGAVTWIGNFYASKQLGSSNYNNIPSTVTGAQQAISSASAAPGFPSRHDFTAYGFTATDDGKMRVLAGVNDDVLTADTAVMLVTGTFNSGVFDWAGTVFDPPTTTESDGTENWVSRPTMAWNEQGTVGYVVIMGSRLGAIGSNVGYQPIVYKTTNSGSTWSLESSINFNDTSYNDVKGRLWTVNSDTTLVVPNFTWIEGIDCAVDANDKLHIFSSILAHPSNHPDSLNFISQWTSEGYLWPHQPGFRPFLYDFVYDGTNSTPTWSHMLVDSMSSEGISATTTGSGYQDNPWDADPSNANSKVRIDARLQMSRTPDGEHLLYTWSESDTSFTNNQKKWNNLPNVKGRLYDVVAGEFATNEIDFTANAPGEVANRAMYQFVSPKFKLISKSLSTIEVDVPMTVSNSNPYTQLTTNTHWYACTNSQFSRPLSVGIRENKLSVLDNSTIYPNPAKNSASVKINMVKSSDLQLNVLNAMGQVVSTKLVSANSGENVIQLNLNGLASGIYFVTIKSDNASATKKLVIE